MVAAAEGVRQGYCVGKKNNPKGKQKKDCQGTPGGGGKGEGAWGMRQTPDYSQRRLRLVKEIWKN